MKKIYIFDLEKKHSKRRFRDSVVRKSLNSALESINEQHLNIIIHGIEIRTLKSLRHDNGYKLINV